MFVNSGGIYKICVLIAVLWLFASFFAPFIYLICTKQSIINPGCRAEKCRWTNITFHISIGKSLVFLISAYFCCFCFSLIWVRVCVCMAVCMCALIIFISAASVSPWHGVLLIEHYGTDNWYRIMWNACSSWIDRGFTVCGGWSYLGKVSFLFI